MLAHPGQPHEVLTPETAAFYRRAIHILKGAGLPFLVGGAYALQRYTGVIRHTKDLDVFVRPADCQRVLDVFTAEGYRTELTFPHWLGKVYGPDEDFIDVIFSSGNGVATVDDGWFEHAVDGEAIGEPVRLCPVEEMIWSKGYVLERERYDGADVNHLLRACGRDLDWRRLLARYGPHWRVLLSHLVLFGFVYPGDRDAVPAWVLEELTGRLLREGQAAPPAGRVCRGTLISREQYLTDVEEWGYQDARLVPPGTMSPGDVQVWTEAINEPK
jgi:hypothetical protein